jgi:hypothetical protein
MQLVAGFPLQRHGFEPGLGYVGFVVDKAALGHVFGFHSDGPGSSPSSGKVGFVVDKAEMG